MAQKVVLINDPGIDGAFAIAMALNDRDSEIRLTAAQYLKLLSSEHATAATALSIPRHLR